MPFYHLLTISPPHSVHTDCASLQGTGTVSELGVLALLHYSFSIFGVAVLFFLPSVFFFSWHKFTLSSILLTKAIAARANQNSRPSWWACAERLEAHVSEGFPLCTVNKENCFRCMHLHTLKEVLPWHSFHSECGDVSSKVFLANFSH